MMRERAQRRPGVVAAAVLATALLLGTGMASETGWSGAERIGYLEWLHSLEQTVAGREDAGQEEQLVLFPFDRPRWTQDENQPYRHLAISKAVIELEEVWTDRENGPSALVALANARNYVHLSEYDSALVWYELTNRMDKRGQFEETVAREALAAALAAGDSLSAARSLTNTLGTQNLEDRADEVVVAYRWLLTNRDARSVDHLNAKIATKDSLLTPRLRFWYARGLAWRGEHDACLVQIYRLVRDGGLSHGLSEDERTWVIAILPDLHLLSGDLNTARKIYRVLAGSSLEELSMWGTNQLAGTSYMQADYAGAVEGYQQVCDGKRFGAWQDRACAQLAMAKNLKRIRAEGEPYGTASFYDH